MMFSYKVEILLRQEDISPLVPFAPEQFGISKAMSFIISRHAQRGAKASARASFLQKWGEKYKILGTGAGKDTIRIFVCKIADAPPETIKEEFWVHKKPPKSRLVK